jgi:hypothetical protein
VVQGKLRIDTGAGHDSVTFAGVPHIVGKTEIWTGDGFDRVLVGSTASGPGTGPRFDGGLQIDSGASSDFVVVGGCQAKWLRIDTRDGSDDILLGGTGGPLKVLEAVNVRTGNANDLVRVGGLSTAAVRTDDGLMRGEFYGPSLFDLGEGSDQLQLDDATFFDRVEIHAGRGRDVVDIGFVNANTTLEGPLTINVGGDYDLIRLGIPVDAVPDDLPVDWYQQLFTKLNGHVTIIGGTRPATVVWHSAYASFNGGRRLLNAFLVER